MDATGLIAGLLMIATGFLVKFFPNLIAGYNTMSKERKEKVDIEGLSTYIRNGLFVIGLTIIIGYYLFKWIGLNDIVDYFIPAVVLVGVVVMVVNTKRFDHNKFKDMKSNLKKYFVGFVLVFVIGILIYGIIPSKVHFTDDSVEFTGAYGTEISIASIENLQLSDKRPSINARTNGLSLGGVKKGFFKVEGLGKTRLLIHSGNGPYLIITTKNGEVTIINFKDKADTESAYQRILALIEK